MPDEVDHLDHQLIAELASRGRATNAALAESLGVAPSTTHARMRALVDDGTITGFHAAVDQARLGRGLQAIIGVTLRGGQREGSIREFAAEIGRHPDVIQLFFVGGTDDFLVHIAVSDSSAVRAFVLDHLSTRQSVASTRTSIIFEYHRNAVAADFD
ncbi:Lrp/AsnC family transcriptional regulator [Microbacterium trichothecenolyticum]|uniref:Lrp/AsnC family transcriptional regulator n=1 Tax=Microbacterium ureisolvens TaxID=2781186 RepID=A0ABS7HYH5_9MICO|nr:MULTISPECIES: Lrp/AsnC family transcriptional regulator [Microbacterium]MBW9110441.1 Lrp/AsnC family transcriptional regulator [Microbacterium ureisolvens]MBW9120546.1 Lrp/AsnC family transcriptional regulator [Microbacterium trichothecenolyticum]